MITNKTLLDYDNIKHFRNKTTLKGQIFITFLCVVVIVCGIVEITLKDTAFGVFCVVVGAVGCPLTWVFQEYFTKRMIKSVSRGQNVYNAYIFNDDLMDVTTYRGEECVSHSAVNYGQIQKAVEYDESFYIYLTDIHAYIVNKQSFSNGTSADLSVLLATKLGERYEHKLSSKIIAKNKGENKN